MNALISIFLRCFWVILSACIGLALQLVLLVQDSPILLAIQESMQGLVTEFLATLKIPHHYLTGYNTIGGDDLMVYTFFTIVVYFVLLLLLGLAQAVSAARHRTWWV